MHILGESSLLITNQILCTINGSTPCAIFSIRCHVLASLCHGLNRIAHNYTSHVVGMVSLTMSNDTDDSLSVEGCTLPPP